MRLRAALAKAVPQTRALSSEERALAAHQARERHLAQVAAACAEEVRRSKKVAEDMKERKAAKEKRYRLEMEERLAEADRRRAEYKKASGGPVRRPRTASVVVDEGEKKAVVATIAEEEEEEVEKGEFDASKGKDRVRMSLSSGVDAFSVWDEKAAARKIQRVWRYRRRRLVVREFVGFGLSVQKVQASGFESISAFVSEERVIHATRKVLQLMTCKDTERTAGEIDGGNTSVRAFLSAYLILGHPTAVFRQDGEQEQLLMSRAKELLVTFESALSTIAVSIPDNNSSSEDGLANQASTDSFSQVYGNYMTAFTAWKASDFSALVDTMVASFVELDAIWQTVKDKGGDEAAEEYREGIRSNQALILGKIKRLAGPEKANGLLLNAVKESRKGRRRRRKQNQAGNEIGDGGRNVEEEDARPRAIVRADEGMEEEGDVMSHGNIEAEAVEPLIVSDASMDGSEIATTTMPTATASSTTEHPQTFQLTRLFSPIPSNRVLAHELALDKSYRITLSPYLAITNTTISPSTASSGLSNHSSSIYAEVCAAMRHGFESGQGDLWTVAMAENIRGKLLHLLSPGSSMYSLISEALDSEHVYRQCSKGVFSYERFFSFMADILPRLCAPVRDTEVKALVRELRECDVGGTYFDSGGGSGTGYLAALIDKLLHLLHFVDLLSLDYSNYMLQQATPLLLKEAPGYEQRLFAQDVENGTVTLERTRAWWRSAVYGLRAEMVHSGGSGSGSSNSNNNGHDLSATSLSFLHRQVYARALLNTAFGGGGEAGSGGLTISIPIANADLPETLALDRDRLTRVRADVVRIVVVGAILLTAKNLLKRDVRAPWRTEALRMSELLRDGYGHGHGASGVAGTAAGNGPSVASRILTILESSHALPPATRTQLQGTIGKVLVQAAGQDTSSVTSTAGAGSAGSACRITDPVMKVLVQRIRAYTAGRIGTAATNTSAAAPNSVTGLGLASGGYSSAAAAPPAATIATGISSSASIASPVATTHTSSLSSASTSAAAPGDTSQLLSSGLSEFVVLIAELAESLKRIGDVDWEAHGRWYLAMGV